MGNMAANIDMITQEMVRNIRRRGPCLCLDSIVQESEFGRWGVILYAEYDFKPVGFHFIESETSWKRPYAVRQYNGLIDDGHCVIVLVPRRVLPDAARMLKEQGGRSEIRLYAFEDAMRKSQDLPRPEGVTKT